MNQDKNARNGENSPQIQPTQLGAEQHSATGNDRISESDASKSPLNADTAHTSVGSDRNAEESGTGSFPPPNPEQRAGGWHQPLQPGEASQPTPAYQQNPRYVNPEFHQLRTAQNYLLIAGIVAPVSLFFGGFILDIVGIVLAVMAYRKLKAMVLGTSQAVEIAKRALRTSKILIGVNIAIGVVNLLAALIVMPIMLEMYNNGELAGVLGGFGPSGSGTTSTWG